MGIQTHRKTVDGRLCANSYTVDQQDFSGCVTVGAPDGTHGREWCQITEQAASSGASSWGYCVPAINYGSARAKAQIALEEKASEISDETSVMLNLAQEANSLTAKVKSACGR